MALCLIDDEEFTVHDREAARLIYHRVKAGVPVQLNSTNADARTVCCLNLLVPQHFREGAATFGCEDMTPDGFELFSAWFNAFAHATDQKQVATAGTGKQRGSKAAQRQSLTASTAALSESGQRKRRKKKRGQSRDTPSDEEESTQDADNDDDSTQSHSSSGSDQAAAEERLDGAVHLGVFAEALFDTQWRVVGYRIHAFDSSAHRTRVDLMTRAMRRSLAEGHELQEQIKTELARLRRTGTAQGNSSKRSATTRTYEANPRYRWAQRETEDQYLSVVRGYFLTDSLRSSMLPRSVTQGVLDRLYNAEEADVDDEDERLARQARPVFTDSRAFMSGGGNGSGGGSASLLAQQLQQQQRKLDMPALFGKEQAMVYHVEQANVRLEQRTLLCYYAPYSSRVEEELERKAALEAERRQKTDRLDRMLRERIDEANFQHFPFPHTTYKIDLQGLSMEVMSAMPLPHRIGATLYNQAHRVDVEKRVRRERRRAASGGDGGVGDDDEDDSDVLDERLAQRPLGLHDVMTDVTPGLLHQHQDVLASDELRQHLTTRHVPPHLAQTFLSNVRNTVQRQLASIQSTLREPKTDLVETRVGGQVVLPATVQFRELFEASTRRQTLNNSHKQYALERRVGMEVGQSEDVQMREREKALARADINFFRSRLGKWRPTNTTVETVMERCKEPLHPEWAMKRDFALVLHCLNDLGHRALLREYVDPATGQIRESQIAQFKRDKREYLEAILVEFWEHFFTCDKSVISEPGDAIRKDLQRELVRSGYCGRTVQEFKFDVQARPYHQYKLQLYKYFSDHCAITYNYKQMDMLWHCAKHHCRYYQPGVTSCKLSMIMGGDQDIGKSWRLSKMSNAMPPGVCQATTRTTAAALLTGRNCNDYLFVNEEFAAKLVCASDGKGSAGDPGAADAINIAKEVMTSHKTQTMAFDKDEDGNRVYRMFQSMCQFNTVGATNINTSRMDAALASRYIIVAMPAPTGQVDGTASHEKEGMREGRSADLTQRLQDQKIYEQGVYYMVEMLIRSGVMEDAHEGVEMGVHDFVINRVLDQMQREHNVPTSKPRKRRHHIELARVYTIAYNVWYVLVAPEHRHLQHDPVTGVFIGLNPRVLLAIIDRLVGTTDQAIDSLCTLSSLWSPDYQDNILQNFAIQQCHLHELRQKSFVHHEGTTEAQREALDCAPLTWRQQPRQKAPRQQAPTWSVTHYGVVQADGEGGGAGHQGAATNEPDDELNHDEIDYNYVVLSAKSFDEISRRLSDTTGALKISSQNVERMLAALNEMTITTDAYVPARDLHKRVLKDTHGNPQRLVRSPDSGRRKERRVLDKGKYQGLDTYAISVAYLKRKLPHLLPDSRIQNLEVPDEQDSFRRLHLDEEEPLESDEEEERERLREGVMQRVDDEAEHQAREFETRRQDELMRQSAQPSDAQEQAMLDLRHRLQQALCIERGDANETVVIKSIREVLEYDALGYTGRTASVDEEEALMCGRHEGSYGDVLTGESPCASYVTSEHPQSLPAETVFGELANANYVAGGSGKYRPPREIPMVDIPATITLKRNPRNPLINYNYMTVSPLTRAALPAYQYMDEEAVAEALEDGIVPSRRTQLYGETSVFRYNLDIDYMYCVKHLREMACPQPTDADGRLINYPPDQYCAMIDYRDEQERRDGRKRDFVPPYSDVLHRIKNTREQLQARRGDLSNAMDISDFLSADYNTAELRALEAQYSRTTLKRRQPVRPATEREDALQSLYEMGSSAQAWKPQKTMGPTVTTTGRTAKSTSRRNRNVQ